MGLSKFKQLNSSGAGDGQFATWNDTDKRWEPRGWIENADDDGFQNTTSGTYQQKLRLTTSSDMPAGDYLLSWAFMWAGGGTSGDVRYRIQINDTTTVQEYEIEPIYSDQSNNPYKAGTRLITFAAGSHNIDIDYSNLSNSRAWIGYASLTMRWVRR